VDASGEPAYNTIRAGELVTEVGCGMNKGNLAIIGCGYVGSALGAVLARRGCDVVGTTTKAARAGGLADLGIRPAVLSLAEVNSVQALLADRQTVYLMVAPDREGRDYRAVYLDGVTNLMRAAAHTAVRHVVYTSSTSVYGQQDGGWVDETSPTEPQRQASRVLVEAEHVLLDEANRLGIAATVLRLGGIVGPGRGPINRLARHAGGQRDDGDGWINLIHRDDVVSACVLLMGHPYHGVLNLTADEPIRRRNYYDRLIARTGLAPIQWVADGSPPRLGKRVCNRLIKDVLDLRLAHPASRDMS